MISQLKYPSWFSPSTTPTMRLIPLLPVKRNFSFPLEDTEAKEKETLSFRLHADHSVCLTRPGENTLKRNLLPMIYLQDNSVLECVDGGGFYAADKTAVGVSE